MIHQEASLCLVVYRGFSVIARYPLAAGVAKIGSDADGAVFVDDASVAPVHAVLEVASDGEVTVADMGSDVGTRINGRPVRRSKVTAGDQITLGAVTAVIEVSARTFASNPFAPAASVAAAAVDAVWSQDTEPEDEQGADAVDVRVLWGTNVLQFTQLSPPRAFTCGPVGSDFVVPATDSSGPALELVGVREGRPHVVVPALGSATLRLANGSTLTLQDCESRGSAQRVGSGSTELSLPHGATATVRLPTSEVVFEVSHVRAGGKPAAAFWEGTDLSAQIYTGMSALVHATLLGTLAFFLPSMRSDDAENVDRDVAIAMKPYLDALAEKEPERELTVVEAQAAASDGGGRGSQAARESGTMGSQLSHASQPARYGIQGDAPDPKLARERALTEAAKFGMVGLLNTDGPSSANAPVAAWGADVAAGHDSKSALGALWGGSVDEMFGIGGLGISGTGEGGGGLASGVGIDGVGNTVGHGRGDVGGDGPGDGPGNNFGPSGIGGHSRNGLRDHVAGAPNPRPLPITTFNGTLPREVVQRIVRQNFGRFRMCYEAGLRSNPGLTGRVAVAFVIDRNGGVSIAAADRSTDMADANVVSCVVRGFQNLSFPAPADGTVQVVYPLMLAPDQ